MRKIAIQISPAARSAYFADYLQVAQQELQYVFGDVPTQYRKAGPLEFFDIEDRELNLKRLLQLSFVQGCYEIDGELLKPMDLNPDYRLHEDFVFGSKYRGKTNEHLTQMLINLGLASIGADNGKGRSLLDPMCGRATTLLWALRYGFKARGIEQDPKALEDIRRNLKKWSKLHRQKHKISDGFIGGSRKNHLGKFLDFDIEGNSMRVVIGDARKSGQIFKKDKFDLLVSDLPYGVQHFTSEKSRNPLALIEQCVDGWKSNLKHNGAIILAFNRYLPKRDALVEVFDRAGLIVQDFSAPHRMSESIVRDIAIFKPAT